MSNENTSEIQNDTTPEIQAAGEQPDDSPQKMAAQATLFETIQEAEQFILQEPYKPDFFSKNNLIKHLNFMKFNPNLEWYNTLLLYKYPDFSNTSYVAKTLDLWLNEIPFDRLNKAIQPTEVNLLCPTVIQNDKDPDHFAWRLMPFYFITNVEAGATEELYLPIHSILEIFNFEQYQMILDEGWQLKFLQNYIDHFRFSSFEDEKTKKFYLNALLYIYQTELQYPEHIELMDASEFVDPVAVYRRLHRLVANLPQYLLVYLQSLKKAYETVVQQKIKRIPENKGHAELQKLMKGKNE